jgi:hypothetical protein
MPDIYKMPPKKEKKPRTRRAPAKKNKGLKQKQKQRQVVNVQVSSGGSGGSGYIPVPSMAPAIDYSILQQLIRPAATVDVPIVKNPEISAARTKLLERLQLRTPMGTGIEARSASGPINPSFSSSSAMPESSKVGKERSDKGKSRAKPEMTSSTAGMMRSESEYDVPVREASRGSDYYRRTGMIPPGSTERGKRVSYEEDIFGRSMPKTSDIRASSSFEPPLARKKSNIRSVSDVLSGAESGFETADTATATPISRFV